LVDKKENREEIIYKTSGGKSLKELPLFNKNPYLRI